MVTRHKNSFFSAAVFALLLLHGGIAQAADKIYDPYVTPSELKLGYFGSRDDDDVQKQQMSLSYGVNDFWKTELHGKLAKASGDNVTFDAWKWNNIFQLTERGQYFVDVGGTLGYEWTPRGNKADAVEARLILAKDIENTSHIVNFNAEKQVSSGKRKQTKGKILWSSRYNYTKAFEPGFEIESDFNELKKMGSFDEQKHSIGPAAYGKIPLPFGDEAGGLKYRVAYLFGVSDAASDGQAIIQLEYKLSF